MNTDNKPYDSTADTADPLRKAEKHIHDLEQSLVDAKLDRDRAVLEAREIIKNVGAASINNYNQARLAREWMQRWFPN